MRRASKALRVKAYRESTANLRNEAGADAAALECQDICETLHYSPENTCALTRVITISNTSPA